MLPIRLYAVILASSKFHFNWKIQEQREPTIWERTWRGRSLRLWARSEWALCSFEKEFEGNGLWHYRQGLKGLNAVLENHLKGVVCGIIGKNLKGSIIFCEKRLFSWIMGKPIATALLNSGKGLEGGLCDDDQVFEGLYAVLGSDLKRVFSGIMGKHSKSSMLYLKKTWKGWSLQLWARTGRALCYCGIKDLKGVASGIMGMYNIFTTLDSHIHAILVPY